MEAAAAVRPNTFNRPVPDHVPPEMVREFNLWTEAGLEPRANGEPHAALSFLHDGPDIFYAPNNTYDGFGTWVITRVEDQRKILQDTATFSSGLGKFESVMGEGWRIIPLELDPPDHTQFRTLLNPLLSPKRVNELETLARPLAVKLIEEIAARGTSCDFMEDFAFPFAVGVFLNFIGLDQSRRKEFLGWADQLLHGNFEERGQAQLTIMAFMRELIALRRREPADDFMSFLLKARVGDRPLADMEMESMGGLIFIAGLDTVAAALGFDFNYLARRPEEQARLRGDRELIKSAVEEMLRAYPTVTMVRKVVRDIEFNGVSFKVGDLVSCPSMVSSRDPAEFPDPNRIDFERDDNRHTAFSYGPHRCVGSHLARRELIIAIEEWLDRMPPFRIKDGAAPITHGGYVFGIDNLQLAWD